ncbi:MAG: phytoene desaturase family protein, partial [Bacteroidia bacterium]
MNKSKSVIVIGSGFSGLSVAACLAQKGYDVTVVEKHDRAGGRARKFSEKGFTFDMGPSWYWMPDVFEKYFNRFGKTTSDFYQLDRLDPSYYVYWDKDDFTPVPADIDKLYDLFEQHDPGSGLRLKKFLDEAQYKYEVGINKLVYKPGRSLGEFADLELLKGVFKLDVFKSLSKHARKVTQHPRLIQILEFPVLFLGAKPQDTPALYSLMNYADLVLGTWFPKGGMIEIVNAMVKIAENQGVKFLFDFPVDELVIENSTITGVKCGDKILSADVIVSSADYHHTETKLLPKKFRSYSDKYWDKRVMAPSSLLYYIGVNKRLKNLAHHNLFFDKPFEKHAHEIYTDPSWPEAPLFYASLTTKTDASGAPEGCENLFLLVPVAAGLVDNDEIQEKYFHMIMDRLEELSGQEIRSHITYRRNFAYRDFVQDYGAFKGNAYGLANTLLQTAILKPSCKSKKVKNLFYTGQLTVPGPGVPPSLISGQVVAEEVSKSYS